MKIDHFMMGLLVFAVMPCTKLAAQYGSSPGNSQEAQISVVVPVAITGGILDTRRAQPDDLAAPSLTVGFRVLATPQLKLGSHWFIYSAVQVYSSPFFYQDKFSSDRYREIDLLQGFVGYTRAVRKATWGFRVGQLSTAFGAFPLRYDDAANPLLDQPLPYTFLKLRPDQLPCGMGDFSPQPNVVFNCGGGTASSYGVQPSTLYGLPGAEADLSWRRLDARLQVTASSPANPRSIFASGRRPQMTAGAGFTIRQGFRVGMSAFRGPWLDNAVIPFLPPGSNVADFAASGLGVDVQWARGPWNASGEWQRFVLPYPNFRIAPATSFGYAEVKRNINPRWYAALRANYQQNNRPEDLAVRSATPYVPNSQAYEGAIGFRPNRFQLLKVGYEWTKVDGAPRNQNNVFGVQLVTSFNGLSKALK
jgi:hypothetical protein